MCAVVCVWCLSVFDFVPLFVGGDCGNLREELSVITCEDGFCTWLEQWDCPRCNCCRSCCGCSPRWNLGLGLPRSRGHGQDRPNPSHRRYRCCRQGHSPGLRRRPAEVLSLSISIVSFISTRASAALSCCSVSLPADRHSCPFLSSPISTWADDVRRQAAYAWSAPLHYLDTPDYECTYDYK